MDPLEQIRHNYPHGTTVGAPVRSGGGWEIICEVNDVWYRTRSPNRLERIWLWVEFGDGAFWLRWIACVFITLLVIVPRYLWWLCVGRWVEKRETTR